MEDVKIKLATMWIFLAVGFSAYTTLDTVRPGILEEMLAGTYEGIPLTEGLLLFFALFWLIPLTMALLSLTLKGSTIRWANIIVGIIWIGFSILDLFEGGLFLAQRLIEASKILVAILIVWHAWKWPKQ